MSIMQFFQGGPDVPERLLEKHEDGEVVLFCGAGISYPAGLPGFSELICKIYYGYHGYDGLKPNPNAEQRAAIENKQFDRAIELLDKDVVGGRQTVRNRLADILTPEEEKLGLPGATDTHEALLRLGQNRNKHLQLVTTNFDRLFEIVIDQKNLHIQNCKAPLLPILKKSRLNHLVYLHGLLPENTNQDRDMDDLVISSGDFGLAYLSEGWAARFVGELFRNFTVCFIGYSIDDPVLRYMVDALAADKLRGESPLEMFAFGGYDNGKKGKQAAEWSAKSVTPILYCNQDNHKNLHKTLKNWADIYQDGIRGKEAMISEEGHLQLMRSTEEDNFVGRILWALSDSSGLPAKRFAELDPIPPLDWLEHLSRIHLLQKTDLVGFSTLNRTEKQQLIVNNLIRWLIRHLDQPDLLLWLSKQAGEELCHADFVKLRLCFVQQIESRLEQLDPDIRTPWNLLIAERIKLLPLNQESDYGLYNWKKRFEIQGLTQSLRLNLRDLLTPRVLLYKSPSWHKNPIKGKIVLQVNRVRSKLNSLRNKQSWIQALPHLLTDFTTLLKDAMGLMYELGEASDMGDSSYIARPSIAEHAQNDVYSDDWTVLIELNRDAWLKTVNTAPEQAKRAAENWCNLPYPVFRRLAFFAATQNREIIPAELGLSWLLADNHCWLWSVEAKREAMRLLVALVPQLEDQQLAELEQAVLDGPPPDQDRNDIPEDRRTEVVEHAIWFRLAKITGSNGGLGRRAEERFNSLCSRHPEWQLRADEGDEFPFFRIDDPNEISQPLVTPRHATALLDWVKQNPKTDPWQRDDWSRRCNNDLDTTAGVLCSLAETGTWPVDRWREALQTWSQEEDLTKQSWCCVASVLVKTPYQELQSLSKDIGWWLGYVAQVIDLDDQSFVSLCERLLEFEDQNDLDNDGENLLSRAGNRNHPIGLMTKAILSWWFREPRHDGQGLTENLKTIFTRLCDHQSNCFQRFHAGRTILAMHTVVLFRVDHAWAQEYLLPLFDWQSSEAEACGAWQGFLCSPRLYRPLMELAKTFFIDTASHYEQLGDICGEQYARFLTFTILHQNDIYTDREFLQAMGALPVKGLKYAATALAQILEGVNEQSCVQFWQNRALPYLKLWPQENDKLTQEISESFARICVAAQDAFPEALQRLRPWLKPLRYDIDLINLLDKLSKNQRPQGRNPQTSGSPRQAAPEGRKPLTKKFPEDSLEFLFLVTGEDLPFEYSHYLKICLQDVREVKPSLKDDDHFQKLYDRLRSTGEELD